MNFFAAAGSRLAFLLGRFFAEAPAVLRRAGFGEATAGNERGLTHIDRPRFPQATVPASPHSDAAEAIHHRQAMDLLAIGTLDILLVGDSLAQHWPLDGWGPWTAFSLGVGGDMTQHVLWRLDRIAWGTCRPRRILIVAGTNNLLFGEGHADIEAGIMAIAERLQAAQPAAELFVLMPPPFGLDLKRADDERRALRRRLAVRFGRRLIDADAALLSDGPFANPNYQPDLVHLTARGYEELVGWARAACDQSVHAQNGS